MRGNIFNGRYDVVGKFKLYEKKGVAVYRINGKRFKTSIADMWNLFDNKDLFID